MQLWLIDSDIGFTDVNWSMVSKIIICLLLIQFWSWWWICRCQVAGNELIIGVTAPAWTASTSRCSKSTQLCCIYLLLHPVLHLLLSLHITTTVVFSSLDFCTFAFLLSFQLFVFWFIFYFICAPRISFLFVIKLQFFYVNIFLHFFTKCFPLLEFSAKSLWSSLVRAWT